MKCEEVQDILSEYLDGEISEPWRREWVAKHLASCPSCQALLADLKRTKDLVRSLPASKAPKELAARIAREVEQLAGPSAVSAEAVAASQIEILRVPLYRRLAPVLMAAAAGGLILFVMLQTSSLQREDASGVVREVAVAQRKPAVRLAEAPSAAMADRDLALDKAQGKGAATGPPAAPPPHVVAQPAPPQKEAQEPATLDERLPPMLAKEFAGARPADALAAKSPAATPSAPPAAATPAPVPGEAAERKAAAVEPAPAEARPAPAEPARQEEVGVAVRDVEKTVIPPAVEAANVIKGMVERQTLLLRAEDVPAATAEVRVILAQFGAQLSRDYYEGGKLEDAGRRIRAQVPGARYQALLTELQKKNYLSADRARASAKPAREKAAPALNESRKGPAAPGLMPETIDLTIKFQAY